MVTNCLRCLWQSELGVSNWASAAILIASCHWSNRNLVNGFAPFPGTDRTFAGLSTTMIELSSYSKQSSRGVMFLILRRDAGKVQISWQKMLWWGNCLGRRSNHFKGMTIGLENAYLATQLALLPKYFSNWLTDSWYDVPTFTFHIPANLMNLSADIIPLAALFDYCTIFGVWFAHAWARRDAILIFSSFPFKVYS